MNKDERINTLAVAYSLTNRNDTLAELLAVLRPDMQKYAHVYAGKTHTTSAEYMSLLTEAVWVACRNGSLANFDHEKGNVMPRIYFYWGRVYSRERRRCNRICRRGDTVSLEAMSEDDDKDWASWLRDFRQSDPSDTLDFQAMFTAFGNLYPSENAIILALAHGEDNTSLARIMGRETYDTCARKRVSRARQLFRDFVDNWSH